MRARSPYIIQRRLARIRLFICMILATFSTLSSSAGLLSPKNSQLAALEIREHHVKVTIEDGYAVTSIDQTFHNPHDTTLEAIYAFPVPEKAAVGEFTYWIDGKPVTGEVLEKQEARQVYEQEKAQGRETAITEQDSYKTFDSSIYPVLPRQDVRIRLVYLQPVHVDHGIGRFVYPLEDGGVDEARNAFWQYNDRVEQAFSFELDLKSSYPVDAVRLPKHPQAIAQAVSNQEWNVKLANSQAIGSNNSAEQSGLESTAELSTSINPKTTTSMVHHLNQDIVVYWRHKTGLPGSIDMITHKSPGKDRGTFMMTITPGDDLADIKDGRDWVFVLDLSGSMKGKYQSLIDGVQKGLTKLSASDRFRVVLFNNNARELTPGYVPASPAAVAKYTEKLMQSKPAGSTNLYAGLKEGITGLDSDRPSAIILVTDGVANVGTTEKKAFLTLLEKYDVRLFTFIMGNSANRPLLNSMTNISNGFATNISNSDDIEGKLMLALEKLKHEAYRNIKIDIDGIKTADVTPNRIGSLYRGEQLIIFGHYWGHGQADVEITGKVTGDKKRYQSRFNFPQISERNPEIERLWAFATIEDIQNKMDYFGEDADSKQAIVGLAKEYSLVTDYTSMVVVREEVFQQYQIDRSNAQRVGNEQAARQSRATSPVQDNRQDTNQPAFTTERAYPKSSSGGGSGALGIWSLLLLLPLLMIRKKRA
ncbi:MAG: VIT and VWA domain-containing protein [Pseudomonadales bacterium]|nr:VIT and VWA domain-containing protein [Pseudomonadales bacterium]